MTEPAGALFLVVPGEARACDWCGGAMPDKATVTREAAQDHLRTLLAQAEIVRSLGASVRQAYEMAGTT